MDRQREILPGSELSAEPPAQPGPKAWPGAPCGRECPCGRSRVQFLGDGELPEGLAGVRVPFVVRLREGGE